MRKLWMLVMLAVLLGGSQPGRAVDMPLIKPKSLTLPAGSTLPMVVLRPVWVKSAKIGDPLYLQTVAPVVAGNTVALPAGTFVQARIDSIVKPSRQFRSAVFTLHIMAISLANGYSLVMPDGADSATVHVGITTENDLFFDNGTDIAMTLTAPLTLNSRSVHQAMKMTPPISHKPFVPATLCRDRAAIPGSPGTPATSDTTIPGGSHVEFQTSTDMDGNTTTNAVTVQDPDRVIPGNPGTPDTPDTPAYYCPDPPTVMSSVPIPFGTNVLPAAPAKGN